MSKIQRRSKSHSRDGAGTSGIVFSTAQKWNAMNGVGRFVVKLLVGIAMLAAAGQSWLWLGWFYPASRAWVIEVQAPIQQQLQIIIEGGVNNRLRQIDNELLQAETQRVQAKAPVDQAKWALQAEKLRNERAELLQKLKSGK